MNSSEPEPERKSQTALQRPVVTITWTPHARREYSLHAPHGPLLRSLNALTRRAIRQTLHLAAPRLKAFSDLENPIFSLDVSFVEDSEMTALNFRHRGKNKATDVLSWSQMEGEWMPSGNEEVLLGDIVISIQTAIRQAQELKHDLEHELNFLVAHGVLHLCGYDHDTPARRRAMFQLQDEIVAFLETTKTKTASG